MIPFVINQQNASVISPNKLDPCCSKPNWLFSQTGPFLQTALTVGDHSCHRLNVSVWMLASPLYISTSCMLVLHCLATNTNLINDKNNDKFLYRLVVPCWLEHLRVICCMPEIKTAYMYQFIVFQIGLSPSTRPILDIRVWCQMTLGDNKVPQCDTCL